MAQDRTDSSRMEEANGEPFTTDFTAATSLPAPTRCFSLGKTQWALFLALLAVPPRVTPALRALLRRRLNTQSDLVPAPLTTAANVRRFACGVSRLDQALKRDTQAAPNPIDAFARRSAAITLRGKVIGYYSQRGVLVQCAQRDAEPDRETDAVPIMLLARLAVDRAWHGKGLGTDLLSDALTSGTSIGERFGARAFYIHALSTDAKRFYLERGFHTMPALIDPLGVFVTAEEIGLARLQTVG